MAIDLEIVYGLLSDLFQAILSGNAASLENFDISPAMYEEIIEELDRSEEDVQSLTLPPKIWHFIKLETGVLLIFLKWRIKQHGGLNVNCGIMEQHLI
jgi:hypothetical protein